jgi:hypothetical protein
MTSQKFIDSVFSQFEFRNSSLFKQKNYFFFNHVRSEKKLQLDKLIYKFENDRFFLIKK